MQLAKRRASLEPIRPQLFQTTRNAIISLPRAVCSKPVTKGRQTPSSALAALLPPLKQNALLRKRPPSQLPSPPPRNRFKLTLEYHVLPQRSLGKRSSSSRQSGLDTITLSQRKESHLNTCYNQENSVWSHSRRITIGFTRGSSLRRVYIAAGSSTSPLSALAHSPAGFPHPN